jgi:protein ImuB
MLWIALHLPELSLQCVEARLFSGERPDAKSTPLAVSEGPETRPVLCAVNAAARELGVRPDQTVSMARALISDLNVVPRNPQWEDEALRKIATLACQFTPNVALARECVLLEVSASLTLFGGLGRLIAQLREGMHASGFSAMAGVAPTPLAAWLFARARVTRPAMRGALQQRDLADRLADLPLALFDWPSAALGTLSQLGITRIRDLMHLPRDGITRRFGAQVLTDLDRALGRAPDPRVYFILPEKFATRVEFMREVEHFEGLRFPIRRMLGELETFLRARGAATQSFTLKFEHGRDRATDLVIGTQQLVRDRERWEKLLVERVTRTPLDGDVSGIVLTCGEVAPYSGENLSWLPDRRALQGKVSELAERLSARLGQSSVFGIAVKDDHRPEHSWKTNEVAQDAIGTGKSAGKSTGKSASASPAAWPKRPLWLLETPRSLIAREHLPVYHGALAILSGPERIETGWWDGSLMQRDYFVARNPHGETLWIYRELRAPDQWFLHGYFA